MEVLLHKGCGRPESRTMTLRPAGPEDAAAFYALQNEVRAGMPHPEQFVPDTLENIARYLRDDLCIGGWDGGRLGGLLHPALLRAGRAQLCRLHGHPQTRGTAGPTRTAPSSIPTTGATACSGSCWKQP